MESVSTKELTNEDKKEIEEIEPKFKYLRLACDLKDILKNDSVSCIVADSKFLCLGTNWGEIYILDHEGNNVGKPNLQKHIVSVNQISVDSKAEYIASVADDGKVFINCLYSNENNVSLSLERKIRCIELDPMYYKSGSGRRFIIGDYELLLYEKTFLKGLKCTILSKSEGIVNAVKWNGQFVAWASGIGVRVYDLNEKCSLGLIKWEEPKSGKLSDFRCNLRWANSNTLLIGWVETIRICVIRKRNIVEVSSGNLPSFIVDPISTFQTDFFIAGLAPLEVNQLVILGVPKDKDENNHSLRPVLCVIIYKSNDYVELCTDSLTLRNYEGYQCNDYHLECLVEENKYFIVSPKDIVSASLYEIDDRVQWLMEHNKFEQAMEVISNYGGKYTIIQVARLYVDYLLELEEYDEAAKLCLRAFDNDKDLWEEEVYKFVKKKQLRSVSPYLPRTNDCKLNPHVYEMVMYEYLKLDKPGFLNLIKEWQPNLYDTTAVINAVQDHFDKKHKNILLEALAILYSHEKEYEKALAMYLKLQHKDVFALIKKYDLYNAIHNKIVDLIKLDSEKAIAMLLEKNKIDSDIVVKQLENHQEYLYMFLDAFNKVDTSGKYHWELINLYPKYDRSKLLSFLKSSRSYPIQDAYDICKREGFYPEMVYLLDRMGNSTEALLIILNKIGDIQMAIEFCREHDDLDLWNKLINESVDVPEVLIKLLDGISGFINPELVINKIKIGQEIPGLKNALVKMLSGFSLQVSIHDGCNQILSTDYFQLHEKLVLNQQRGVSINFNNSCGSCDRDILAKDPKQNVIVFNCRHMFHEDCLAESFDGEPCVICNKSKKS